MLKTLFAISFSWGLLTLYCGHSFSILYAFTFVNTSLTNCCESVRNTNYLISSFLFLCALLYSSFAVIWFQGVTKKTTNFIFITTTFSRAYGFIHIYMHKISSIFCNKQPQIFYFIFCLITSLTYSNLSQCRYRKHCTWNSFTSNGVVIKINTTTLTSLRKCSQIKSRFISTWKLIWWHNKQRNS